MTREWTPGDVAFWDGGRIFREGYNEGQPGERWMSATKGECWPEPFDNPPRPLVVIDPESIVFEGQADDDANRIPEIVNCLRRIAEGDGGRNWRSTLCLRLADEFERQARPPRCGASLTLGKDGALYRCTEVAGHDGPHVDHHCRWTAVQP